MASKNTREKLVPVIPTSADPDYGTNHLEVHVSYRKDSNPRGVYLSVTPVGLHKRDGSGFESRSFMLFSGKAVLLEKCERFNPKRLDALAAATFAGIDAKTGPAWELLEAVRENNKLTLTDGEAVAS